jgi:hypothetical protein
LNIALFIEYGDSFERLRARNCPTPQINA